MGGQIGILFVLLFAVAIAVMLVIAHLHMRRRHQQRIAAYLQAKGATDITVSYVWPSFDRSNDVFEVSYTLQGQRRRTMCKVQAIVLSDDVIYWKDPV